MKLRGLWVLLYLIGISSWAAARTRAAVSRRERSRCQRPEGDPTQWTEKGLRWKIELPGVGHSSPVIWKEFLYVATSTPEGERTLRCLNAMNGKQLWAHTVRLGKNGLHKKNSYASATPAVDAERVYITFGDE